MNSSEHSIGSPGPSPEGIFAFAFNNKNLSDRQLHIHTESDISRKRRRSPSIDDDQCEEQTDQCEEQTDQCEEQTAKIVYISSSILAAYSGFFRKLFTSGMSETSKKNVILNIQASEEDAVMDVLSFMYTGVLNSKTQTALIEVLIAADQYEVISCMQLCNRLLCEFPMTRNSALIYLELPQGIVMSESVKPLIQKAKECLAKQFSDLKKSHEEAMKLPIAGLEAVLSSNDLMVAYEDVVYEFLLEWAQVHYPKPEDRKDILSSRLLNLVRFPHMTCNKLEELRKCTDIEPKVASEAVIDALFFKAASLTRQRAIAAKAKADAETDSANVSLLRFVERSYANRPLKVVEFETPRRRCMVYLNLKREECEKIFPTGRILSETFDFGGEVFFLSGICCKNEQSSSNSFGLSISMLGNGTTTLDYEFSSRTKPSEDFVSRGKRNRTIEGGKAVGYRNLFGMTWTAFMAEDSPYFINDTLFLRAEIELTAGN